jgi:hypothetical protein
MRRITDSTAVYRNARSNSTLFANAAPTSAHALADWKPEAGAKNSNGWTATPSHGLAANRSINRRRRKSADPLKFVFRPWLPLSGFFLFFALGQGFILSRPTLRSGQPGY